MALIHISGKSYELIHENKNGWNPEAFRNRYSEVLERYDYIIGDWGYNQLRLKGFFRDGSGKATKDTAFSGASDYLNEYCNFGCAYFILEKKNGQRKEPGDEDLDLLEESPRLQESDLRFSVKGARGGAAEAQAKSAAPESGRDREREAAAKEVQGAAKAGAGDQPARDREPARESSKESGRESSRSQQPRHKHHGQRQEGQNRSSAQEGHSRSAAQEDQGGRPQEGSGRAGGQDGRKRDHYYRKGFRGHDGKGKKPAKLAAGEAAAASENGSAQNRKESGRAE